jgi:hypothetical protein
VITGVDLLRRNEVVNPGEPTNVNVRKETSEDSRPDLLVHAGRVAITQEDRKLASPQALSIEWVGAEGGRPANSY